MGGMRYFIYNEDDTLLFGAELKCGQTYSYDFLLPEHNEKLGEVIDNWLRTGRSADEFIEVKSINNNTGGLILALKELCESCGLKCEVKIF
jgi:hypothetical protein